MDRELSKEYLRNKRKKAWIRLLIPLIIVLTLGYFALNWVQASVDLNNTLVCIADKGMVENSFTTNGIIEPYYQEVLTASLSSDILKIKHQPGDIVSPQDTIMIPDVSLLMGNKQAINDEIDLKRNRIKKSQEELKRQENQLISDLRMDSIRSEQLKSNLEKEKYLFEIGGGSQQKVNQAEIDYKLAAIQRENQLLAFTSFERLQQLDLESMELELSIKNQAREKIIQQLNKAYVQPKINGIITSVLVEPGQYVSEGQALAQVADAHRFKIKGEISTRYADRIYLGQEIIVEINDSLLNGSISSISPSVANGNLNYTVNLDNPAHPMLRAKLRVEVRMILSISPNTIRIKNSDFYFGPGKAALFVLNGDKLEKREVKLGGSNFDYVEVLSGIQAGETVVISKSFNKEYERYNSIKCKK